MATLKNHASDASQSSEFEQRRAVLVGDIGEVRFCTHMAFPKSYVLYLDKPSSDLGMSNTVT